MAGKARKQREREVRKKAKQAKRERNRALYAERMARGANSKSKRHVLRGRRSRKSSGRHLHQTGICGNPGCNKCFPAKEKGPSHQAPKPDRHLRRYFRVGGVFKAFSLAAQEIGKLDRAELVKAMQGASL
jgi:hypothetical protein